MSNGKSLTPNPCTACDNNQAHIREHLGRPYCKCGNCGAFSWPPKDTREKAIKDWNEEHPLTIAPVKRCHGCGHNFYTDSPLPDGRCSYCHNDDKNADPCWVCSKRATCSGECGYLCHNPACARTDSLSAQRAWEDENEDFY